MSKTCAKNKQDMGICHLDINPIKQVVIYRDQQTFFSNNQVTNVISSKLSCIEPFDSKTIKDLLSI